MNLVLFTHPASLALRSQDRFAQMLLEEFLRRGHRAVLRRSPDVLRGMLPAGPWAKWAGYVDQYLLFPRRLRAGLREDPPDTLYVFCDQALGPWVPHVVHRPHVIHCHDLLALRSALGEIAENPTSLTGRLYQRYIRAGLARARHFISISERSRAELHRVGRVSPRVSEVVYNGLNHPYRPLARPAALATLAAAGLPTDERGCLLHVGGGQWYKNTAGLVRLYAAHVRDAEARGAAALPLWMVGPPPGREVRQALATVPRTGAVRFFQGLGTDVLEALYSHAHALLFPSHAEGFGWPILEALACGCPVVTTADTPMTEVGGTCATYLPRLASGDDVDAWARQGAVVLDALLRRDRGERTRAAERAIAHAAGFSADAAIERYLAIYERILDDERRRHQATR